MGRILQAAASVASTKKVTISLWAKIDSVTGATLYNDQYYFIPLLEFGTSSVDNMYNSSGVWIQINKDDVPGTTIPWALYVNFSGVPKSYDYQSFLSGNWNQNADSLWSEGFEASLDGGDPTFFLGGPGGAGGTNSFLVNKGANCFLHCFVSASLTSALRPGKWFHLLVSCDTSIATTPNLPGTDPGTETSINTGPAITMTINAVNQPFTVDDSAPWVGTTVDVFTSDGTDVSGYSTRDWFFAPATSTYGIAGSQYTVAGDPTGWDPNPEPGGLIEVEFPAFDISLSGKQVQVPGGLFFTNAAVTLANVIMYTDRALTASSNVNTFVNISGGVGTPQPFASIAATLGYPSYAFKGNHLGFVTNAGTGGTFSTVGTLTDGDTPMFS